MDYYRENERLAERKKFRIVELTVRIKLLSDENARNIVEKRLNWEILATEISYCK